MLALRLSAASGVPYYRQVHDQIAEAIRAGRAPPGSRLPSVRELASELLVSVITVRRAYEDLEAQGFIERQQGRGTFVAEVVAPQAEAWARQEARVALREAVSRARRMGLDDLAVRLIVDDQLRHGDDEEGT